MKQRPWSCPLAFFFFFKYSPRPLLRDGIVDSGLGPSTSISNQENAAQANLMMEAIPQLRFALPKCVVLITKSSTDISSCQLRMQWPNCLPVINVFLPTQIQNFQYFSPMLWPQYISHMNQICHYLFQFPFGPGARNSTQDPLHTRQIVVLSPGYSSSLSSSSVTRGLSNF